MATIRNPKTALLATVAGLLLAAAGAQAQGGSDDRPFEPDPHARPGESESRDPRLDSDGDGVPNSRDSDDDGDGLTDEFELEDSGTNPILPDSDGDSSGDGAEVLAGTDPNRDDTDGDGLTDGFDPEPLDPTRPPIFLPPPD